MSQKKEYPGFWHAVLLCTAFLVFQLVLIIPLGILDAILGLGLVSHPAVMGGAILLACGMALGMGWLIGRPPFREVLALHRVSLPALIGVLVGSAGMIILLSEIDNLLRMLWPAPDWIVGFMQEMSSASEHPWGTLFLLVLVAPITEETIFRGLILRGFLTRFTPGKSILWSALLFGAVHLNPWQFFSAAGLGLIFGWWYTRSRSLVPALLGHALANATVYAHQLLPFKIRGFNAGDMSGPAEFQPAWFDGLGVLLLAGGWWLFCRSVPPNSARTGPSGESAPVPISPG